MDRFISDRISDRTAYISSKEETSHIIRTLRMKEGDMLEVTDGKGRSFAGEIANISKEEIEIRLLKELESNEPSVDITVYQGIPKAQKMDLIIQKLTEVGACAIVPVKFERCVRVLDEKEDKQIRRWTKIAEEAVKQSKRSKIPRISNVMGILDLEKEIVEKDLAILCYESEQRLLLKDLLQSLPNKDRIRKVGIIIGPEGGITENEQAQLVGFGAKSALIGKTILRTETASIVAAGILTYELG